jgi:hypothetical protein
MALLRVLRNLQVSQARRKHPPATTSWFRVASLSLVYLLHLASPGGVGCAHPHHLKGDFGQKGGVRLLAASP